MSTRTLAIIKPGVSAEQAGHIMLAIGVAGFMFRETKVRRLTPSYVDALYCAHVERDFYSDMRDFMCSDDVVIMVLQGNDAVSRWRTLIGATDPAKAAEGTIRKLYGDKSNGAPMFRNAVHGSDSDDAAEREIALFFGSSCTVGTPVLASARRARLRPPLPEAERQRLIALDEAACDGPTMTTEEFVGRLLWAPWFPAGPERDMILALHAEAGDGPSEPIADFMARLGLNAPTKAAAPVQPETSMRRLPAERNNVDALCMVDAELRRGRAKFPGNRFLLAALAEEVGELALAMAEGSRASIRAEAFQVAAVAIRIAEEGDATTYHPDRLISLVHAVGGVARGFLQRQVETANYHLHSLSIRARAMMGDGDPTFDDITDEEAKP